MINEDYKIRCVVRASPPATIDWLKESLIISTGNYWEVQRDGSSISTFTLTFFSTALRLIEQLAIGCLLAATSVRTHFTRIEKLGKNVNKCEKWKLDPLSRALVMMYRVGKSTWKQFRRVLLTRNV